MIQLRQNSLQRTSQQSLHPIQREQVACAPIQTTFTTKKHISIPAVYLTNLVKNTAQKRFILKNQNLLILQSHNIE